MMKIIKVTSCEECPHFDYDNNQCVLTYKSVENCTKIPAWCPLENELAAWKAEAMASREYIDTLEEFILRETTSFAELFPEQRKYAAACVEDGE